jgi:hypothetical protein
MALRRRMLAAGADLPPMYKRADYIQTISHNARFDSGVPGNDTTLRIEFDWMLVNTGISYGSYYGVFGNAGTSGSQQFWRMMRNTTSADPNATYWLIYAGTGINATIVPYGSGVTCADKRMHCVFEYGTAEVNGVRSTSTSTKPMSTGTIWFGTTTPTSSGIANNVGRFWYIKIWSHGELIRDYVPCVRIRDNIAGFYDRVNNTYNPSIGSAEFVAGYDA